MTSFTANSANGIAGIVGPVLFATNNPVLWQMSPNNSFYQSVNSQPDGCPHAAIIDRAWDKWTEWRLLGDTYGCGDPSLRDCGHEGRRYVQSVDKGYHVALDCSVTSGLLGIIFQNNYSQRISSYCAAIAAELVAFDAIYKRLSVGHEHGDGVVPESSQTYPSSPGLQFLADDSDSHLGETHSTEHTGLALVQAMNRLGMGSRP
jgi:hypothetical protein